MRERSRAMLFPEVEKAERLNLFAGNSLWGGFFMIGKEFQSSVPDMAN